ncbi:MAPRE2.2 family protein [Megaselia abdita]
MSQKGETLSRHDYLRWVNESSNSTHKKIEELCSGVVYCRLLAQKFPSSLGLSRMKATPKMEIEYIHNLKLLQSGFSKLKLDKSVPIDRLVKGKFQDNFEFLQWFKKFYDSSEGQSTEVNNNSKEPSTSTQSKKLQVKENPVRPVSPNFLKDIEEEKLSLTEKMEFIENERNFYYSKLQRIEALCSESQEKGEDLPKIKLILQKLYETEQEF